jgi:peptidyl-prolyl cis-trans isomerase C
MLAAVFAGGVAGAQPPVKQAAPPQPAPGTPAPSPSPAAPGDLKRPIFDTLAPVFGPSDAEAKSAATVVAEVEGRAITLGDVKDAIAELPPNVAALPFMDLYPGVLNKLIRQQALVIRAQRQAVDEDPVTRRKVKAAADRVLSNEILHAEISKTVTEDALLALYNKEYAGNPGPDEVHARVIMLSTEEAAAAIIQELKGGADFAALAKRSSQDTTAPVGGDLGWLRLDGLNAEIGSVAFSMAPGMTVSYPVRSAGAWFVVRVEERRPHPALAYSEVRERLVQTLLREGVPDVVGKAMAQVSVQEFTISGKEADRPPGATPR